MIRKTLLLFIVATAFLHADINSLIPLPNKMQKLGPSKALPKTFKLRGTKNFNKEMALFVTDMKKYVNSTTYDKSSAFTINFQQVNGLAKEAYKIKTSPKSITVSASHGAGAYYAAQTLIQIFQDAKSLPQVAIEDQPRFGWRGLMIDSSRHFQTITETKRFIGNLAHHKFNVFHWHITDMSGWRIEIKKYPKLTSVGAWRMQVNYPEKGKKERYGGFYSQKEIKDVIKYAAERHVTILPEVDFPGHFDAAIAAYPELGCTQKPQTVFMYQDYPAKDRRWIKSEIDKSSELCVSRPFSLEFTKDVLDEVMDLFPSHYIHIGGDEAEKHAWRKCKSCQAHKKTHGLKNEYELQSWYIKQLDEYIHSKGRIMVGWDEIREGGLAKNAAVMSWKGVQAGIKSAQAGHEVIMTPSQQLYLNFGQSHSPLHPPNIGGYVPVEKVYKFDPHQDALTPEQNKLIKGLQGNVWTEFIHEEWKVELQTWPRACAIAEIGWTDKDKRDFKNFEKRLDKHRKQLDSMKINYWWEESVLLGAWSPKETPKTFAPRTIDISAAIKAFSNQEIDISFGYIKGAHALDLKSVSLLVNGKQVSIDEHVGITGGTNKNNSYKLKVPTLSANDKVELKYFSQGNGGTDSNGKIGIYKMDTIVKEEW